MDFWCNKMVKFAIILMFFIFFFLSGCIVTKSETECQDLESRNLMNNLAWGEVAMCYHEVAVVYALKKERLAAIHACDKIYTGNELGWIETSERNSCYSDIAEILPDDTICENIKTSRFEDPINIFKTQCKEKAKKKMNSMTKRSLCTTIFIFIPLVFLFYSYYNKKSFSFI